MAKARLACLIVGIKILAPGLMKFWKHDWSHIAAEQPYFGVLSESKYRTENLTEHAIEDFYASGVADICRMRELFDQKLNRMPGGRALDFGCGAGRHALAMAAYCEEVVGYDISGEMLSLAAKRANRQNIANVKFCNTLPKGEFDWINSYIVFQHIPPKDGLPLLDKILTAASPTAIINIYFPVWCDETVRPSGNPISWLMTNAIRMKSRMGFGQTENLIQMHTYEVSEILRIANNAGFRDMFLKYENHNGFHGVWFVSEKSN